MTTRPRTEVLEVPVQVDPNTQYYAPRFVSSALSPRQGCALVAVAEGLRRDGICGATRQGAPAMRYLLDRLADEMGLPADWAPPPRPAPPVYQAKGRAPAPRL